ncbi:unnamed protein product [Colias eurytheme]|nr:unnamed protein product [Colias eurytheme]
MRPRPELCASRAVNREEIIGCHKGQDGKESECEEEWLYQRSGEVCRCVPSRKPDATGEKLAIRGISRTARVTQHEASGKKLRLRCCRGRMIAD